MININLIRENPTLVKENMNKYNYVIRGKSNFYKKQVALMQSDDEWIEVEVDDKWLKRFSSLQS